MNELIKEIKNCTICKEHLVADCRPVFVAHPKSKIFKGV